MRSLHVSIEYWLFKYTEVFLRKNALDGLKLYRWVEYGLTSKEEVKSVHMLNYRV